MVLVFLLSCSNRNEKIVPEVKEITESVYTSVTVQPDSLYEVHASVNGILESNLVEEGEVVLRDTPLFQIINTNSVITSENARLSLELAQKEFSANTGTLASIKDEIKGATLTLLNDSINYHRQKNLWERKIGSKADFDAKKLKYELSQNTVDLLKDRYQRTEDALHTQLEQARNNFRNSKVKTSDFMVESKINGTVYALYKNPGEIVSPMEPIGLLGSSSVFIIEMLVDEIDIVKVKKGQEVLLTLDAYGDAVFLAFVSRIYPKKDERNQTFRVDAIFDTPPKILYPGLAGEANIVIAKKERALVIPRTYLINDSSVLTEDGEVPVEIGLCSLDFVEILSGIDENTPIYKPNHD